MVHTKCSISLPSVPAAKTTTEFLAFFVPVTQKFTLPTCSMLTAAVNDFSSWSSFLPGIYVLSTQPDLGSQPWQPACVKGHPINTFEFLEGAWHDFAKNLLMPFLRAKLISLCICLKFLPFTSLSLLWGGKNNWPLACCSSLSWQTCQRTSSLFIHQNAPPCCGKP